MKYKLKKNSQIHKENKTKSNSLEKLILNTINNKTNMKKTNQTTYFRNKKYIKFDKNGNFHDYYTLLHRLGYGSSSIVKACMKKSTGNNYIYAVKIFNLYEEEHKSIAINEFFNMSICESEYICRVYEIFLDEENYKAYMIMENCKGVTIKNMISLSKRLNKKIHMYVIYQIIFQLIIGVMNIHKNSIVHR